MPVVVAIRGYRGAMVTRSLGLLLVAALATTLVPGVSTAGRGQATSVAAARATFRCHGIEHRDVEGPRPTYTRKTLARFRNDRRVCRATWLPRPRKRLVPQGLSVSGRTGWVAGYQYSPGFGSRPCSLMKVDLTTGQLRAYASTVVGAVGKRKPTYCRHGGGVAAWGRLLWVVEKNKLWLVDPAEVSGGAVRARRVWRLSSPVRGSSVLVSGTRIGLVPFQKTGRAHLHWFEIRDVMRRRVLTLGRRADGRTQLGAAARTRIPTLVQGATVGPDGGLYLTRSNLACGELVVPGGRRIGFVPGAEGIGFRADGKALWVASESGARPFAHSRKPLTPAVSSFEWPGLLRGRSTTCDF